MAYNKETGLTDRQMAFCHEYLIDLNGTKAAMRSGYSSKTAESTACENLRKPKIISYINGLRIQVAESTEITPAKVAAELAKLGFSNIKHFLKKTSAGDPFVDLSDATDDQMAALSEVTVEDFMDGRGEDAREVRRVKIKLSDKRAALVALGNHLGMFTKEGVVDDTTVHVIHTIDNEYLKFAQIVAQDRTALPAPVTIENAPQARKAGKA